MDQIADFGKFQRLMARLGATMDKFVNDELVESWWKALRTVPFGEVERRIEDFIAKSTDSTKWPRPGQFRPASMVVEDSKEEAINRRIGEENAKNWRAHISEFPTTGPLRHKMAVCARIMAGEREDSAAFAEAQNEYFHLEKLLGDHGRFSADR